MKTLVLMLLVLLGGCSVLHPRPIEAPQWPPPSLEQDNPCPGWEPRMCLPWQESPQTQYKI